MPKEKKALVPISNPEVSVVAKVPGSDKRPDRWGSIFEQAASLEEGALCLTYADADQALRATRCARQAILRATMKLSFRLRGNCLYVMPKANPQKE